MGNPFTPTGAFAQGMLADVNANSVGAYAGTLAATKLAALTGAVAPTVHSTFSQFSEATFDGYARSAALVWGAPFGGASSPGEITAGPITMKATDANVPNTITGMALFTGAAGSEKLLGVWVFDTPIPIINAGDGFVFLPRLLVPPGTFGDGVVLN